MRTIRRTTAFKKDFKRLLANPQHTKDAPQLLLTALTFLVEDRNLPESFHDHALIGNWNGHRECHVKPDLLLVYRQPMEIAILELVRLGSHAEIFNR